MAARVSRSLALAALALLVGCVSKPTVELHHAEIRGAGPTGISLLVFLRVNNDNSFDVQIRNVRVRATLAGRHTLPPIVYSPNQWLRSDATTVVQVPMVIPWTMVPAILGETVTSSEIAYRVRGDADVTAVRSIGIRSDRHPVDEKGTIPRAAVLDAARRASPLPIPF